MDTQTINLEDVKLFFDWLDFEKEAEFRIITPDKKATSHFIQDKNEALELCKNNSGKNHVFIGINERINKGTKTEDIPYIRNFVLDIDNKGLLEKTNRIALQIREESITQGFKEPLLIMSGGGYHLYFALEPIENNETNRERIKFFGKSLKKKYETPDCLIDEAVFEPARVMRVAGTFNIKPEVQTLSFITNPLNTRQDDKLLTELILSITPQSLLNKVGNEQLETSIRDLIANDDEINVLFNGDYSKFPSRSEAEESLVFRLVQRGLTKEQIFKVMASCKLGKWQEGSIQYRELTFRKALEKINQTRTKQTNPFKNLDYLNEHLSHFDELNSLLGLYGEHYRTIKKSRWYSLLGGVLQKTIILGDKYLDTRFNCLFPLPTEGGKNDLIYLFKSILPQVRKNPRQIFSYEEPVSYHAEQLVGKMVESMIDNPNGKRPPKIKIKTENRGYFNSDFLEIDEASVLFFSNDEQIKIARAYISKALNPIGRNEIVKRLVDDLPEERIAYCPVCTMTLYFQPRKIPEELILQGILRRFIIPVGNITPFLNYGSEEDFKRKIRMPEFPKQTKRENLIAYLDKVRAVFQDKDFVFTQKATEQINIYLQYLLAEGQTHSEKISNLVKLIKWTIQDHLIRMSAIIAGSFFQEVVNENHVALAYMDLVELLQSHFDFVSEWVEGNFDYGTRWKFATYKERLCLEYLFQKDCFSASNSVISIAAFCEYIAQTYELKETRARQIYLDLKRRGLVDSKQIGTNYTRVWLTFVPETQSLQFEGDKGYKGFHTYKSIVSGLSAILTSIKSMQPLQPSFEFDKALGGAV